MNGESSVACHAWKHQLSWAGPLPTKRWSTRSWSCTSTQTTSTSGWEAWLKPSCWGHALALCLHASLGNRWKPCGMETGEHLWRASPHSEQSTLGINPHKDCVKQLDLCSGAYGTLRRFSLKQTVPNPKTMLTPNKRTTRHIEYSVYLEILLL